MSATHADRTETETRDDRQRPVIIRTLRLKKAYRIGTVVTEALRGVDTVVHRGEFIAVMGPSGSGKTTYFNMIGGLDSPTSGRVFIDEVDVAQLNAVELAFLRCHKIGYIFQSYNLVRYMTALENVTVPMVFAGATAEEIQARGMALLQVVGLADRWHHKPVQMSGGQQQRVAIARSMANNPAILLCDEPTANLDLKTGREILDILMRLNKEKGVTIICATHDHRMLDVSDRMIWIRDGCIERIRRRDEVAIEVGSIDGETE
ncbi:MAG: ABC transporter ATP-binding protein [Kiritimatiellae bacterium]|nr:ABC transporter ATP-binding protein [Kiritimatiellia bacterium]